MTINKGNVVIKLEENEIEILKKTHSILKTICNNLEKYEHTKSNCEILEEILCVLYDIVDYTDLGDNIDENTFICSNDFK